jgi:hypothetical protein
VEKPSNKGFSLPLVAASASTWCGLCYFSAETRKDSEASPQSRVWSVQVWWMCRNEARYFGAALVGASLAGASLVDVPK